VTGSEARQQGQRDAITAFTAKRQVQPNAVTLGSWNYRQLAGTAAEQATALDIGDVPALEIYDGAGAYRCEHPLHAERAAELALQALELDFKRFEGQGSTRHFDAGRRFTLVDHPLYGSSIEQMASHGRPDNEFTLLPVEHHIANNLGAQPAKLLGLPLPDSSLPSSAVASAPTISRHARIVIAARFIICTSFAPALNAGETQRSARRQRASPGDFASCTCSRRCAARGRIGRTRRSGPGDRRAGPSVSQRNIPPDTSTRCAVIQRCPGASRPAMASPMSSGWPTRPSAVWAAR